MAEPPVTQPEAPSPPAPTAQGTCDQPSRQAGSSSAHREARSAVEPDGHSLRGAVRALAGLHLHDAQAGGLGCSDHRFLRQQ